LYFTPECLNSGGKLLASFLVKIKKLIIWKIIKAIVGILLPGQTMLIGN